MYKTFFSIKYIQSSSLFFLFFISRILFTGLVSIFLLDQGYTAFTVSTISSLALIASFIFVPIIGQKIDNIASDYISTLLLVISGVCGFIFAFSTTKILSTIMYCIIIVCINTLHPIVERTATQTTFNYNSIRIWGTIGNAVGSQLGGACYQFISPKSIYVIFGGLFILAGIVYKHIPINNNTPDGVEIRKKDGKHLKLPATFIIYSVIVFLFYGALDTKTLYLNAFLCATGYTVNSAAYVLFWASLAEVPVVVFGGKLVNKCHCRMLLSSCLIILATQLLVYAFSHSPFILTITTFFSNSVVSMLFIMVNMKIVYTIIDNNNRMFALTLTSGIRSLAAVIGQIVSGQLIDRASYQACFMFLSAFALMGLIISFTLRFPTDSNTNLYI